MLTMREMQRDISTNWGYYARVNGLINNNNKITRLILKRK
jgi:hypothetical protein